MPPRKTKKKIEKVKNPKVLGLFDHLKALTERSSPNYWETISESDRKTFSPYMINRFLSMNMDWVDFVDTLQRFTIGLLKPRDVFRLFDDILPKGRIFLPYVKAKETRPIPDAMADLIAMDCECSLFTAKEYCRVMLMSPAGREELISLMNMYGMQTIDQKKLKKELGL